MSPDIEVLIAGAGPTGLAAALFLTRRGVRVRIVDQAAQPSATSRAQVINPRSFELLEASGVGAVLLAEARPLKGARFYDGWNDLAHLEFSDIHPRFPMAALPQARTEAILAQALASHGVAAERPVSLSDFNQDAQAVSCVLDHPGRQETVRCALLLSAQGAHSTVRHRLGIDFGGSAFPEAWPLYDIALDTSLDEAHAHVSFVDRGLVFVLYIGNGLWRVFGNVPAPLNLLPPGSRAGEIAWQSEFHISHRLAAQCAQGRVALAGDAAHIHSPVAARGMNLGIEDAYVFAACARDYLDGYSGRLDDYGALRHQAQQPVVKRIERLTWLARGQPGPVGTLRRYLLPGLTRLTPAAHAMLELVTGLDHAAETGENGTADIGL